MYVEVERFKIMEINTLRSHVVTVGIRHRVHLRGEYQMSDGNVKGKTNKLACF